MMDKLSVQQKSPKHANLQAKKKKKGPIKVVYISNPVRVTTTASEFKCRVQELTGQDSDVTDMFDFDEPLPPPPPVNEMTTTKETAVAAAAADQLSTSTGSSSVDTGTGQGSSEQGGGELYKEVSISFDVFDDEVFQSQYMMESFTDLYTAQHLLD